MRILEFQPQRVSLFVYLVILSYEDNICFYEVMFDSEDGHSKFSPENFPYFRFYYGLTNLGLLGVHKDSKKEVDSLNLPGVSLRFIPSIDMVGLYLESLLELSEDIVPEDYLWLGVKDSTIAVDILFDLPGFGWNYDSSL
jgi:hypothetical protein